MVTIGIDTGNAQCKSSNFTIPSGIKEYQVKPASGDYLCENGRYYVPTSDRLHYQEDKTVSREYWVLTNILIVKELNRVHAYEKGMEIALSVGLPPEHMFNAEKIKAWGTYFKKNGKNVCIEYNGKTYEYTIKMVNVYPQGFAIVALNYADFAKLSKAYIVDIGGYTVDILTVKKAKLDPTNIASRDMGIITFYNEAISQVKKDTSRRVDEDDINDFLMNGKAGSKEVTESLKIAFDEYSRSLISFLNEMHIDIKHHNVTFMGGGSIYLRERILAASEDNKNITFETDVNANAKGFQKYMEAALLKRG